jgi:hypothetical protein
VLGEDSVRYWTTLGGPKGIRRLREEESILIPLCRSRGIVEASDLVTGEKAEVLKNIGSQYTVEIADFTKGNLLPTFSLIFTEFESEGFLFQTTW